MELVHVTVSGYKRIWDKQRVNLQGKLVTLLGPNQSGKSSFLDALNSFNTDGAYRISGAGAEISRGKKVDKSDDVVRFAFWLSKEEEVLLKAQGISPLPKWLFCAKTVDGSKNYEVDPKPVRNKAHRKRLSKLVQRLKISNLASGQMDQVEGQTDSSDHLDKILSALDSETETLEPGDIALLAELLKILQGLEVSDLPKYVLNLVGELETSLQKEQEQHPFDKAISLLSGRVPQFLLFSEADRDLQPEYEIVETQNHPQALRNLAALADLDLALLRRSITRKDMGARATTLERANRKLRDFFESWGQEPLTVHFSVDAGVLHVAVDQNGEISSIAESSDGLRQFVALIAFLNSHASGDRSSVLLIDEIERHLHYDAQVDVVQMFEKQKLVQKIVYTTHSIGCMPANIGSGIRVLELVNDKGKQRSRIHNWFWKNKGGNLQSLLTSMGASLLAFMSFRFALLCEGPADIILLPRLFQEAILDDYIGFQIMPGLSEANDNQVEQLKNQAARTSFLVDNDDGGKRLRDRIIGLGVASGRVFISKNVVSAADLLDRSAYIHTVKKLVATYGLSELKEEELPTEGISAAVHRMYPNLSKREIACQILEDFPTRRLLASQKTQYVRSLHQKISASLAQNQLAPPSPNEAPPAPS